MKRFLKVSVSFLLVVILIFSSACVGFGSRSFSGLFVIETRAEGEEPLVFTLNDDGEGYSLTACNTSVAGEVVVPEDYNNLPVTGIGKYAFNNCTELTAVVLGPNVKTICDGAFSGCTGLTAISIPEGVTNIGYGAFRNCSSLTAVEIPDSVVVLADSTFSDCSKLTSVTISKNLNSINSRVFSGCSSLESIVIPHGVAEIGDHAFYGCSSLAAADIPDSVTVIDDYAFCFCTGLTSVSVPDNVNNIGAYAFRGCTKLNSITIPDSGMKIESSAFYDSGYYSNSSNWENGVLYIGKQLIEAKTSIAGDYAIKEGTKSIADLAFYNCEDIVSIDLPGSVTNIGYGAFYNCYSLVAIAIPDSVNEIGEYALCRCTSLEAIELPDGLDSISDGLFSGCSKLNSIIIPDGVKTIGDNAFYGCTGLTTFVVPEGVNSIGNNAFADCTELKSVTIPSSVTNIGRTVFLNNASLGEIITPCTSFVSTCFDDTMLNLKHGSLSDWVIGLPSTCTQVGEKHRECSACGEILETETIAVANHTSSDWKTNASTRTKYKECTACGEILESQKIPLAAPTINSCYNEVDGVQLGWTAVGEANSYAVYRKLPTETNWTLLTTTSALSYRDKKVAGNTAYQYSVKALDQYNNESDFSALKENRFIATPKLTSRANAVGGVQITWQQVAGATSYRIYRRGAGSTYWYYLGDVPATQSSFLDKEGSASNQIKSGNYYRYTVRASYDGQDSFGNAHLRYSGFDTNGLYLKYVATPKLKAVTNATNGITVTWNAVNGGGSTWYRVYRRGAGSTYWTYLGATQKTTFTDTAVSKANNQYYRYTVRAVAGTQDSGWYSAFDTNGLFLKRLVNPTLVGATSAKAGITVRWKPVAGTTGYYVYRKTASSGWKCVGTVKGTNNVTFLDKSAVKGTTYTYTVRACYGTTTSYFNSGIKCYDKY